MTQHRHPRGLQPATRQPSGWLARFRVRGGVDGHFTDGAPGCCVLGLPAFPSSALGPVPSEGTAPQLQPTAVQCRAMGAAACTTHLVRRVLDLVHAACTFLGPQCGQNNGPERNDQRRRNGRATHAEFHRWVRTRPFSLFASTSGACPSAASSLPAQVAWAAGKHQHASCDRIFIRIGGWRRRIAGFSYSPRRRRLHPS